MDIVQQAQNELHLIRREIQEAYQEIPLETIFSCHGKEAMMRAKFYYECKLLDIPCVLEVRTQFGRVDAIIELSEKYYIIEFKSSISDFSDANTNEQLSRYIQHQCPVILISETRNFAKFLMQLRDLNLDKKIYYYENESLNLYN